MEKTVGIGTVRSMKIPSLDVRQPGTGVLRGRTLPYTAVSREAGHYRIEYGRPWCPMVGHTPSGCFRSGGQDERRTGHPAFSGQLGHEGTNQGQKMPGCAIGTIIPSSTRQVTSRMVPYGLFLIAAMMISSLKSTKPSIKSCWNEASCTTLLCVPERIRVNIGAIPSIIKSCFLEILQRKSLTVTVRRVVIWSFAVGERISFRSLPEFL